MLMHTLRRRSLVLLVAGVLGVIGCSESKPAAHHANLDEPESPPPVAKTEPRPAPRVSERPPSVARPDPPATAEPAPAAPPSRSTIDPLDPPPPPRQPPAANLRPVAEPPATFAESGAPDDPNEDFPAGITVLESIQRSDPTSVSLERDVENRVIVVTRNVRRLRLQRSAMNVAADRRAVLRIDNQGFEWTTDVPVLELERSRGGEWTIQR